MKELTSPFGLIAGGGSFPIEIAQEAKRRGLELITVALMNETDPTIEKYCDKVSWIKVGQLGKLLKKLSASKVKQAIFCGSISRANIFQGVLFDLKALGVVARVGSLRDDRILRGITDEIEKLGIEVLSPSVLLTKSLAKEGRLTQRGLTEAERKDARYGWHVAKTIGSLDVGQTVVISDSIIVAVECTEGTDGAILRGGELTGPAKCTVVKVAKPQQDLRLDLPSVGIKTLESMKQAGATALVLEHEKALILEPDTFIAHANKEGIAVEIVRDENQL